MRIATPYQIFLLAVLVVWPLIITGTLFLMGRLEKYVERLGAETPEEAGLAPVKGSSEDREVRIVYGDRVIGEPAAATTSPSDHSASHSQQK